MNSTQLQQLFTGLQKQVNDQQQLMFVDAASALELPLTANAYKKFVPDAQFQINQVSIIMPDSNTILIAGDTDSFGFSNSGCKLTFYLNSGILNSTVDITILDEKLALPGIDWFSIEAPFYNITVPEAQLPVVGWLGGNIATAVKLQVAMAFPITNDIWLFQGSFSDPLPNISNFYQLVGGVNLSAALPQPLSTLTTLGLQNIDVSYNAAAQTVDYIGITIGTPTDYKWQLLPGLAVTNIGITCLISGFGSSGASNVKFTITGNFTIGPDGSNNIAVIATAPNFTVSVQLTDGTIQLGDLLTMFWSGATIDLKSEITTFNLLIDSSAQSYSLNCGLTSDWTFLSIANLISFTMTGMSLDISSQQGSIQGKFTGNFHIGPTSNGADSGVDLTLFAGYQNKTWTLGGSTGAGQTISLTDIAFTFLKPFGLNSIPSWVNGVELDISNVSFVASIPDKSTGDPNTYQTGGTVTWLLNFNSFNFSLEASVNITFSGKTSSGSITGKTTLIGLEFTIGYKFGDAQDIIFLLWKGIAASYTHDKKANTDVIAVTFDKMSLGDIITDLIASFEPGFQLTSPWSFLNSIDLDGLSFTYTRNLSDSSKNTLVITYSDSVNLGFLNISKINLTKDSSGVFLGFEGNFLGLTITSDDPTTGALAGKGSDVRSMPAVPGLGSEFFDLKFLGMGQHVELTGAPQIDSVNQAITAMTAAFTDTNSEPNTIPIKAGTAGPIAFNQDSSWLIGANFTVAKFFELAFVFNDPNLYGLAISISKDSNFFANLQFEILYKKINDSIGVYQIELQLPDQFRHLEFGEVSITLPNIGIKIYTNGNFYLDIGWPTSITDFSRSFTIQVFPFLGSGGFYFGYLSGATASNLPATHNKGVFNPVIEAGIALSLGVGKTINEGILKAGLSLTAVGIFQGTFATYTPNPNTQYSGEVDHYYKFQGTVALVGRIYGEVNFAIISASFDIVAYVSATLVVEAYMSIPISFEAGVSVNLSVKINLGLFKITIHLSFSTTIHASFIIGSSDPQNSLWYKASQLSSPAASIEMESFALETAPAKSFLLEASAPVTLKWQPITIDNKNTYGIDLYFVPHLTISGETLSVPASADTHTPGPQYVGMLYIDTVTNTAAFTESGMMALGLGTLYWTLNAIVGSAQASPTLSWLQDQQVTTEQLNLMLCYFQTRSNNEAPFNYKNSSGNDIENFLKNFFEISISGIDENTEKELAASVFPILPELQMQTVLNKVEGDLIDFSSYSMTGTTGFLDALTTILKALSVDYETQLTADYYASSACDNVTDPDYESQPNLSMSTFIFTDFIALVAKQLLQNALDYMTAQNQTSMKVSDVVNGAVTTDSVQQLGGMASRFMLHGLRLPEPPDAATGEIQPLYVLTGQQFTIPSDIKKTDTYQINLMNPGASWISFVNPVDGKLEVSVGSTEIQRILDVGGITLDPSLQEGYPKAIVNFNHTPQNFSLGGNSVWNYPGDFFNGLTNSPTLWKTPPNFQATLASNTNPSVDFTLQTITTEGSDTTKGVIQNFQWATVLTVNLQKITAQDLLNTPLANNVYNLVGVNDASVLLLEQLITYMNDQQGGDDSFISQIQFLMVPDPNKGEKGYVSAENGQLDAAIVKANLSTETNPEQPPVAFALKSEATPTYNTLNKPADFITQLWECSIVRSGGFYFYYITATDGNGLPEYLFSETGVAEIQIVITYNKFIAQQFMNGVVTGDDLNFSNTAVYAQSSDVTVLVPTIPSGNVGYELIRNNPGEYDPATNPPALAEDQVYLQNQFNLLGTTVPSVNGYENYMPAGPTDPMSEADIANKKAGKAVTSDPSGPWNYTMAIPYYKFVQPQGIDPNYPNPYVGIGTNVQMKLNWQDMFGNLPSHGVSSLPVAMELLYTDTIVALSQWPSMTSFFLFQNNPSGQPEGQPEVILSFCFDTSRYSSGGDDAANKAKIDLQTYMLLYYQLQTDGMSMSYNTSIDGTKTTPEGSSRSIDIVGMVTGLVEPIINYLKTIAGGSAPPNPSNITIPYTVSSDIDTSTIASYADSIPLKVSVAMQRTKHVDPNFANSPGIASAETALKPQSQENACAVSSGTNLTLTVFSTAFENAFKDQPTTGILLKVATASDLNTNGNSTATESLWFVRFDNTGKVGIRYTYDNSKVYFYSPIPLATSLVSLSTGIYPYETGKAYPAGTAVQKTYSTVDLDTWGKQFLEAVDAILSPGLAVPAFLLDNGESLQKILDGKETLAEAIEGTIDFIIEPSDKSTANIGNAQEKWKQQILIQLSNTYRYSAAVQTPTTIDSLWTGSNNEPPEAPYTPKLYGNIVGNSPSVPDEGSTEQASTEYSLSTAKLPIANGASWLTYMFEAKDTPEFRNFSFGNMQYPVSHLEQQIETVAGIEGYLASTWLTFVIPLDNSLSDVGEITIPIPLRSYPTPPSITQQGSTYPTVNPITTMEESRTWDFTYSYVNSIAAQDTIETQVELNIPENYSSSSNNIKKTNDISLDEALAQFIAVSPAINADFQAYLSQLTQKDVEDNTAIFTNSQFAVDAFINILNQVSIAWSNWNQVNPRNPQAKALAAENLEESLDPITLNFTVVESGEKETGYLEVNVQPQADNTMPNVPAINIEGYTAQPVTEGGVKNTWIYKDSKGKYLNYEDRNIQPQRNVSLKSLDIINSQNAWGGALIIRNMDLLPNAAGTGWQTTNERFIYQTPLVKFYTKLLTLLDSQTTLDIATIGTKTYPVKPERSLADNMGALFEVLTDGVDASTINIKLHCEYQYMITGTQYPVTIPVILATPFDLSTTDEGQSFAATLTSTLTDWLTNNISGTPAGTFEFVINAFSSFDPNKLIFQLPLKLDLGA